jgi:hypothetical protein
VVSVYLLDIGGYAPEITELTYPWIGFYADKIGADICKITERQFPDWPVVYEKLQIHELARERRDDWSIYFDSDALVHPELPDLTTLFPPDTVAHNGHDFAGIRWRYDEYFRRDGRHIGSCNWLAVASSWCRDLWRPLDDLTFEQAVANITVSTEERRTGIGPDHLVDDYALSRNIARFGLKFVSLAEVWPKLGLQNANFFHHQYTISDAEKVKQIRRTIEEWRL